MLRQTKASASQKITTFFKSVTPSVHKLNNLIEFQRLDVAIEEIEKEREMSRQLRQQQSVEDVNRRLTASVQRMSNDTRTDEQIVRDNIEILTEVDNTLPRPTLQKRRKESRPEGWETVARHAMEHGDQQAFDDYIELFKGTNLSI